jgi:RNA polymerase sigma factor (sigma-70 family)
MGRSATGNDGSSRDTEALYREHQAAVAAFCRSVLRDRGEAEDATQQVFLSAHRALLNGSAPREPLAWLLTVARHECYARFRRRATSPVANGDLPDSATPDASVQVLRAGELASMWDEVAHMPPAQREAFLLREIRGLSYGQLAAELSLSPPSVRSLLVRARVRLRHRLRDVAAGLGGAQWVQTLLRLFGGGDGPSLAPSATKAAAVGIGALALVSGGGAGRVAAHSPMTHSSRAAGGFDHARAHRTAQPVAAAAPLREEHQRLEDRGSIRARSHSGDRSSGGSDSNSGSSEVSNASSGSGHDGSDDTTATTAQPTTESHDGGHNSTTTTSSRDGSGPGTSDGSSSGSSSGSDSTTTTTSSDSHGGGSDDGSSGGGGSEGRG